MAGERGAPRRAPHSPADFWDSIADMAQDSSRPPAPPRPPWWQRGVIYHIYPRSFFDATGDGVGDLPGVAAKLDYLSQTLGVDAIWLSPFYRSPMVDFGYDVTDHCDVDPLFGTLADFDRLLAEAHARGLKLILDYVPNHTSDQHPWFRESRASRDNPRRDWYVWADPKPDGSPPNNWLAAFGGRAWEWDPATGQYYLHSFLPEQPDLNWRNPAVRQAMLDVLRFWLDRGVDGFRMDTVHRLMKDPLLGDNPPNPTARPSIHKPMGAYDTQLHLHDMAHPDVHEVLRSFRRLLDAYAADGRPRLAMGEIHLFDPRELCRYYGQRLDELHLPCNFGLLGVPWQARAVRAAVDAYEAALPGAAWPNYVLGNHDESRIATRLGRQAARLAMLLLLTLRGTPTLYYGDELGLEDVPVPPDRQQDPWGKRVPGLGLGRDPARAPMPWDNTPNAGFCPPDVEPWLPIPPDYRAASVARQAADPRSMLSLTRRLLALRHANPALAIGAYHPLEGEGVPEECYVYLRQAGGRRLLVALNFAAERQVVRLAAPPRARWLVSTHLDRDGPADLSALELRPSEGGLLELAEADG